ncbi:polar amino acid ABC transporter substrate-binding protein [Actinotalea ferrariae CF5-4]|uniref:Polar amino acid ABC transporter substrate-binding protein n=1 Tax=Actinotalea ferrariae CF5-4 TaxID=948458 RepID=A0A021VWQ5_9CELL|nr:amino acid ABC transporter substrate-binding protein [Actinotalea ferrariae]EYR63502.1 polar amino acid ABC transporter substrate-binding protein [Actinotalea ferrariae CF5-4]
MTRFTRMLSLSAAATAVALAAAGCSAADDDAPATPGAEGDTSWSDVQEAGVLVVGTEGTYRPFSFHEDGSGDLVGYDVEVIEAVAEELGVDIEFEETQWDAIFAGLEAGRFDVVANQVSITPEREEAYTFTEPYTVSNGVIVVRADDDSIDSFASLDGKVTAQSLTSNWHALAEESGAQIEAVEGWAQAVALVEQERVDATINDELTFLDYAQTADASGLKVAAETEEQSFSAFALADGSDALARAIDEALATLAEDGTLAEISVKYFGADVSR